MIPTTAMLAATSRLRLDGLLAAARRFNVLLACLLGRVHTLFVCLLCLSCLVVLFISWFACCWLVGLMACCLGGALVLLFICWLAGVLVCVVCKLAGLLGRWHAS